MIFRYGLCLLAASAATAAIAQSPPLQPVFLPERPNQVESAVQAFGDCARSRIGNVDRSVAPEAEAAAVVRACGVQLQWVRQAADRVISSSTLPADRKAAARDQLEQRLNQVQARLTEKIRARRL